MAHFIFRDTTHTGRAKDVIRRFWKGPTIFNKWRKHGLFTGLSLEHQDTEKMAQLFVRNGVVFQIAADEDLGEAAPPVIMYSAPDSLGEDEDMRWFKVHWVAGSYAGVRRVRAADGEEAEAMVRGWVRQQMAIPQYYESYRAEETEELDGLDEAPKRYKRPPRVGTRVRFAPNPASRMLYSENYPVPEEGEEGTVTTVAGPRGPMSSMRGPGGGLVYVEWDDTGFVGVSLYDIEKA